ncbi:hypothetical protein SAMN05216241_101124 [Limimonas halophila]|uniref:Glycosyl transferase family 2 n=1 Tax=Limimonas halophila TaxID=1082479 RepID=A0A1G7L5K0_9PROT|nr:hypothetical protein [Limimonas halophila]SDF44671.1 hypothetical protein SAMN05216241_101124 [Limimonas halophila]
MKPATHRTRRPFPVRLWRRLRRSWWRGRALAWEARLRLRNRLGTGPALQAGGEVIVSMTTHQARLGRSFLALETLFDQDVQPGAIQLNLAAEELSEADLPQTIQRLRRRGLQVRFVAPDYKSGNKLIPTYAAHPDRILVTADDDCLHPSTWLSGLLAAHAETPDAIVCHRGLTLRRDENGHLVPYKHLMKAPGTDTHPGFAVMATGVSGVLYPPHALHPRVHDHGLMMRLCPSEDDVWFKAMSLLQGTPTRRAAPRNPLWLQVSASQRVRLFDRNVTPDGASPSDACLRTVFEAFELDGYLDADDTGEPRSATAA